MTDVDPVLRQAKRAVEGDLLNRPGVVGVDIGFKEVNGEPTDQLAVRVLVKKKREVSPEERVPERIAGFPTDVIERSYELQVLAIDAEQVMVQPDAEQYEALKGGISVGPCRAIGGTFLGGTLGVPVTDNVTGKAMLLSNFHVLCGDRSWTIGDYIAQPARIDQGTCPSSIVASVQRAVLDGQVDCAVAEVTARTIGSEIAEIGPVMGTGSVAIGEAVRKRGRTTGLTYGFVDSLDMTVIVPYPGIGEVTLTNQIGIRPDLARNAKFSSSGDSGAALVNAAGEVVGLHFAGNAADGHGAANPIAGVLAALNVSIPANSGATPPTDPRPTDPIPAMPPGPILTPTDPIPAMPPGPILTPTDPRPTMPPGPIPTPSDPAPTIPPTGPPPGQTPSDPAPTPPPTGPPPGQTPTDPIPAMPPPGPPPGQTPTTPTTPPPAAPSRTKVRPPMLTPYPPPYPPPLEPAVLLPFPPAPCPPWEGWS